MNADTLLSGMIAIELGLVVPEQLDECVRAQASRLDPRPIGEILRERGYLTERQLRRLLTEQKRRFTEFSEARLFGQIALGRGFVGEQQLGECIREQLRVSADRRPMIGQVMLRKGYLSLGRFAEVIAEQGKTLFQCLSCESFHARPGNAPLSKALCPACGKMLRPVDESSQREGGADARGDTTVFFKAPLASLGKFQILGEIARGSMGIVFKAHDSSLDRTVALKVLKEGDADEAFIRRLHREGAIAAKLRHPNIVTVHEVGQIQGLHYLCMDYIAGTDLVQHIHAQKMERRQVLGLLETICRAVHYAHMQGVIHRDLKPSNILVTPEGTPILTDFGLAKSLDASADMTKEGTSLGTPHYMPPEQVLGAVGKIDPRSDVYSLGAILFELVAGRPPFTARTTIDLYQKILSEEADRPSLLDATIEPDLEAIILKALEKERDQRYFSAEDLALDLRRHIAGEAVMAARATPARLWLRKLRRYRTRIAVLAAVALLAVGVTLAAMDRSRAAKIRRLETEAALRRGRGEWEEARKRYEQILALDPSHETAQREWAECWRQIVREQERQKQEAEKKGQATAEEERERRMAAARPHYEAGFKKFYDAFTLLHQPDHDPRQLAERYRDAIDDFTRALDRAPDFADAWFLRAKCQIALGADRRAEEDLGEALRLSPSHSAAFYERGKLRYVRAFTMVSGALLARDAAGRRGPPGDPFASREARDLRAESAADFENAVYHTTNTPSKDEHFVMAAFLHLAEGRGYDAVVDFCHAIGLNAANADAHFGRALAHVLTGDLAPAIRHFDEAARLRPNLHAAILLGGAARAAAGDIEGARREFEALVRRFPHPSTHHHLASVLALARKYEESLRAVDAGLALDPDDLPLRRLRAGVLLQMRRFEEAVEECRAILVRDPGCSEAHKIAAIGSARLRDFETAYRHFKRALDIDPKDDGTWAYYASVLQQTGKWQEAWDAASQALTLHARNAHARFVRAVLLMERGRDAEAESEFRSGLALDPEHATGHLMFGRLLAKMRRWREAIAEFEAFARLDPSGRATAERLIAEARKEVEANR